MNSALRNAIRAEIQFRSQRRKSIPAELLGEPAWDILLDLAISYLDGRRIQTTAAGLNAGLPPTTALRWTAQLFERGLVRRVPDEVDGRRTWLELTRETMARIAACFGYELDRDRENAAAEAAARGGPDDRPVFFPAHSQPEPRLSAHLLPGTTDAGAAARAMLLTPATDWFDQTYSERLSLAAQMLYVQGYLAPQEYRRIEQRVREDTNAMRNKKADARLGNGAVRRERQP